MDESQEIKKETTTTSSTNEVPKYEHSQMPGVIAFVLTFGLLAFAGALLFVEIPKENQRLIDTLFGGLIVGCTTAWNYYYSTSQAADARAAVRVTKE